MNYTLKITRRQFMKLSAVTAAVCLSGLNFAKSAYSKAADYVTQRLTWVYRRDADMEYRKSQDNPMITKIYKDFLEYPLSHKSEHLLHTDYVPRGARIKELKDKGIKLTA